MVDVTFFCANLLKLLEGAWVPLLFGVAMVIMILTWRRGTAHPDRTRRGGPKCRSTTCSRASRRSRRTSCPGTAVFLTSDPEFAPTALLHNLKHNKVLHEHNVILTIDHRRHAARRPTTSGCASRR